MQCSTALDEEAMQEWEREICNKIPITLIKRVASFLASKAEDLGKTEPSEVNGGLEAEPC